MILALFGIVVLLSTGFCVHVSEPGTTAPLPEQQTTAPQQTSTGPADLLDQARRAVQSGDISQAEALLDRALALTPGYQPAHNLLGNLLLGQSRFAEAMDHFEAVLTSSPRDATAREGERKAAVALALQRKAQGDGAAALRLLERGCKAVPDDPTLLTDLGIQADALHQYSEATEALRSALRLRPADSTAQYALARTELDNQHPVQAEELFRAYLAQRPSDASAHYGLGHLLQMQQRTAEATAEFNRSLSLQPVQTESYYQLGQMALDEHRDEDSRGMFEKTLSRMPAHGGALSGMGILAFRAKNFDAARKWLQEAIAASPDYEPAHYYLGLTLARLGDKEGSTRELANATRLAAAQQGKGAPIGVISSPPEPR